MNEYEPEDYENLDTKGAIIVVVAIIIGAIIVALCL